MFVPETRFVSRHAADLTGNSSKLNFDQLLQIAIQRGLVPGFVADGRDNFRMRQRLSRSAQQLEHGNARRGCPKSDIMNALLRFAPGQGRHPQNVVRDDLPVQGIMRSYPRFSSHICYYKPIASLSV